MTSVPVGADRRPVPVRTILTTIGLVLATALLIYVVLQIRQVLTWIVVGAFFAVALYPVVGWVQRRLLGGRRRALATFLVFLVVFILLAALIAAFAVPLVNEGTKLAGQLPEPDRRRPRPAGARSATCCSGRTRCSGCRTTRTRSASSPAA